MKVSYRWLRDVAPGLALSPDEAVERLALRGAPVEEVVDLGRRWQGLCVGRVVAARPHPNADRLTLCRVEGPDGEVSVVCGAPNVEVGALYPFAPVGASLPGGMRIGKRKIRGEVSEGMLCSESELELGSDRGGILKLEGDARAGQALAEALRLDDWRFDVEVTPNRGDLASHLGVARELHPEGDAALALPPFPGPEPTARPPWTRGAEEAAADGVRVRVDDAGACPRYLGAVVRDVSVGPSPPWLVDRLHSVGARSVNNVVDATNYVMLETGQPLHAFDLDKLEGAVVAVGPARGGETLATLDGRTRTLAADLPTIRDAAGPVAVAGVMGGADSQVADDTESILLECARFEPRRVRAARRALGLSTDASYRFERGVDPSALETALLRALDLIESVSEGASCRALLDACPAPWTPPVVTLRPSRVERVLGEAFSAPEIEALLAPLGYETGRAGPDALEVRVPGHRCHDTLREIDLIEEIARSRGYDAFAATMAPARRGSVPDHPLFQLEDELRAILVADGLSEAQTPSLGPASDGDVPVLNPMSRAESHLRRDRLSGLLRHVERNLARGVRDVRLFEIGTAFGPGPEAAPVETPRVAAALTGLREPEHWSGPDESFDVHDAARLLDRIAGAAFPGARVVPAGGERSPFAKGRRYELVSGDGDAVGWAGEVDADAMDLPPWAGPVLGAEVALPATPDPKSPVIARDLPDQPASERDLAFLVPDRTPVGEVVAAARKGAGRLLEDAHVFDLYRGDDLPPGVRSVALRLRFRARGRTLTDGEVDKACRRAARTVRNATGVEPRG